MKVTVCMAGLCISLLCGGLHRAQAEIVYDFGGRRTVDFEITDSLVKIKDSIAGLPTTVELVGPGRINGYVRVYGNSTFNLAGGRVFADVTAHNNSHVNISAGSICDPHLTGYDNSSLSISGGSIHGKLSVWDSSSGVITGGSIGDVLDVHNHSVLTVRGTGFNYPYGTITESAGVLTGTLAAGEPFNNRFTIHDDASIVLVPEPSAFFLLGLGFMLLSQLSGKNTPDSHP